MNKIRKKIIRPVITCLVLGFLNPGSSAVRAENQAKDTAAIQEENEEEQKEKRKNPVDKAEEMAGQKDINLDKLMQIPGIMDRLFPVFQRLSDKKEIFLENLKSPEKRMIADLLKYRFLYDLDQWENNEKAETEEELECYVNVWCVWSRIADDNKEEPEDYEDKLLSLIQTWYMDNENQEESEKTNSVSSEVPEMSEETIKYPLKCQSIEEYESFIKSSMKADFSYWTEQLLECSMGDERQCTSKFLEALKHVFRSEQDDKTEDLKSEEPEDGQPEKSDVKEEQTQQEQIPEKQIPEEKEEDNSDVSETDMEEVTAVSESEQFKTIAAVPGYTPGSAEVFQTIRMTREEKKELKEKEELKVLTDPDGKFMDISVRWITEEDFLGTDKSEYKFTLKTEKDYIWAQPLKADYENKKIVRKIIITDCKPDKIDQEKNEKKKEAPKRSIVSKLREVLLPGVMAHPDISSKAVNIGSWDAVNFAQMKAAFLNFGLGYDVINVHIRGNISFRERLTVPAGKQINIISLGPSGSVNLTRAKGFTDSFFYIEKNGKLVINKNTAGSDAGDLRMDGGAGSGYTSKGPIIINYGQCDISPKTIVMRNKNIIKSFVGGGIFNNGTVTMDGAELSDNSSFHGGAVFNAEEAEMTIKNSVLSKNSTYVPSDYNEKNYDGRDLFNHPNGGAVFNLGVMEISASRIQSNTSRTKGGGVLNYQDNEKQKGRLEISGQNGKTIISGNRSEGEGGGIYNCGGLKISDSIVSNNQAVRDGGGGILTDLGARAEMIKCTIQENTAGGSGGGIFNWTGSKVTVRECTVKGNQCKGSGGGGILIWENSVTSIQGTTVAENHTPYSGGGILLFKSTLNLSDGQCSGNVAGENGGGIYVTSGAGITMSGGSITGNSAKNYGGGMYILYSSNLNMTGGEISSNRADYGGGIYHNGSKVMISRGGIGRNTANLYGGGIFALGTVQTGSAAVIESNKAEQKSGGGIYVSEKTELTLNGSTIRQNIAGISGGGIHSHKGIIHMKNGAISNNTAVAQNGGGLSADGGTVVLESTAINSNRAGQSGGGIADYGQASVTIKSVRADSNSAKCGGGIYVDAALMMSGMTQISENNDIYLAAKRYVTIDGQMTLAAGKAAVFTPDQYKTGRKVAEVVYGRRLGSSEYIRADKSEKFGLTKKENYVLRPGDYQVKEASTNVSDIVISQKYQISYQKNLESEVHNIPGAGAKYWYENTSLSKKEPSCIAAEFLGWSTKKNALEMEMKPGTAYTENKDLTVYAIWNTAPVIETGPPLEYWEGQKVTKEMLLDQVKASDKEDQILGKELNIRIIKIQYADGRIKDGEKQPGEVKLWEEDMPKEELLDTWQMAMDQADSPVLHVVTYAVTDSQGLTSKAERQITVKYNEFPDIRCEDCYFTLEEAQDGKITEDILLKEALSQGTLKVTDDNNDILDPEHPIQSKTNIIGYNDKEFSGFEDSGYVKLSYTAEDSLGKQTVQEFTVYVCKDGEEKKDEQVRFVRFINQKNYRRNQETDPGEMSEEELAKSRANGGLRVDSYWYQKDEYRNILLSTLENPRAERTYMFDEGMTKEVKAFVESNGISNTKKENALMEFAQKFLQ